MSIEIDDWTPSENDLQIGDRVLAPYRLSRWERFRHWLRHPLTRPPETIQAAYIVIARFPSDPVNNH